MLPLGFARQLLAVLQAVLQAQRAGVVPSLPGHEPTISSAVSFLVRPWEGTASTSWVGCAACTVQLQWADGCVDVVRGLLRRPMGAS